MRHLALICSLLHGVAVAEVIHIDVGEVLGGAGDLTSNVLMAEHLQRLLPNATIRLVVSEGAPETVPTLRRLFPSWRPDLPTQTVNGLTFIRATNPPPRSDFFFQFSSRASAGELARWGAGARHVLAFGEYAGRENGGQDFPANRIETSTTVEAGASPAMAGLYLTPEPPRAPLTLRQIQDALNPSRGVGPPVALTAETHLGFSYTSTERPWRAYLEAVSNAARRGTYGNRPVIIVSNFPVPPGFALPPGLRVLTIASTPFPLAQSLIARSNIPIQITGDVSLTLAIQHGKPFFYETLSHKEDHALTLRQLLTGIGRLEAVQHRTLLETMLPSLKAPASAARMAELMESEALQRTVRKSIEFVRERSSLPRALATLIEHWDTLEPKIADPHQLMALLLAARRGASLAELRKVALDPSLAIPPPGSPTIFDFCLQSFNAM